MKELECYYPGKSFPSVSITGPSCSLNCPHCSAAPLRSMKHIHDGRELIEFAMELASSKSNGFLLSGGCDSDGGLPLTGYLDSISEIKSRTGLRINAHIGFPPESECRAIASSGVDSISLNYPISDEVGERVFRIQNALSRYQRTVSALKTGGCKKIATHFLLGISNPDEEKNGLERMAKCPPKALIFISFRPFEGTPWSDHGPASDDAVIESIEYARILMPNAKFVFGCMRPKGKARLEERLMTDMIDGIVLPSRSALSNLSGKIKVKESQGCCALYL